MKKFTKKLTKAVMTLAAVAAFNAAVYAGDIKQSFDQSNWPGSYTNNTPLSSTGTAVELNNLSGVYTNNSSISGGQGYGIYSLTLDELLIIKNFGTIGDIGSNTSSGIRLGGYGGHLENFGIISSGNMGVHLDGEVGTGPDDGFFIDNRSIINGSIVGIYQIDDNQKTYIINDQSAYISGTSAGIALGGVADIRNDGLIQGQYNAAISLQRGGVIVNNGRINSQYGKAIQHFGWDGTMLTLQGTGSYEGIIEYVGAAEDAGRNGILIIDSPGMDLKNSRIVNWGSVAIDGGEHYMNFQNDGSPGSTNVYVGNNAYLHTGYGGPNWGDANFHVSGNSLINPRKNLHNNFWDKKAVDPETGTVLYDRKDFAKLTVNNLYIDASSGLLIDIKNSEPAYDPQIWNFDEDDRTGYYADGDYENVQSDLNPDGSYSGFGYSTRILRTYDKDQLTDLYIYQRVNFDKVHVMGESNIEQGAKLYLVERTMWLQDDGTRPVHNEFEGPVDSITLDIFDGNINFDDFDIDFYSDYYGINYYDNNSGKLYLTKAMHKSSQKGQVDWWLKEASLGFADSNPAAAAVTANPGVFATSIQAVASSQSTPTGDFTRLNAPTIFDQAQTKTPVIPADNVTGGPPKAAYGGAPTVILAPNIAYHTPVVNDADADDDDEDKYEIHPVPTNPTPKPELLSYQIAKSYSAKITDLDTTLQLRDVIYSFQGWNDIDAFMDSLNKLEYASLATSNLNMISNRVAAMYNRLGAGYDLRDKNNISIWGDVFYSDDSLSGKGDHDINGNGTEFVVGFDKLFNDKLTLGMSFNQSNYESVINDSGSSDQIDSEGYGLNAYAMLKQNALTHKMMLGYTAYENTGDNATFDSDELFAAYRAEYTLKRDGFDITWIAGLRYSKVKFDEIRENSENGLRAFDQDSLETEFGVELSKQFKRLGVSVSGAWMHELLDSQTRAEAFTSFGNFSQDGIARDTDSLRMTIGLEYKLSDKVTLDLDYAKEASANSDSDSINGKITFRF